MLDEVCGLDSWSGGGFEVYLDRDDELVVLADGQRWRLMPFDEWVVRRSLELRDTDDMAQLLRVCVKSVWQ